VQLDPVRCHARLAVQEVEEGDPGDLRPRLRTQRPRSGKAAAYLERLRRWVRRGPSALTGRQDGARIPPEEIPPSIRRVES
jgi:hypothetical protein